GDEDFFAGDAIYVDVESVLVPEKVETLCLLPARHKPEGLAQRSVVRNSLPSMSPKSSSWCPAPASRECPSAPRDFTHASRPHGSGVQARRRSTRLEPLRAGEHPERTVSAASEGVTSVQGSDLSWGGRADEGLRTEVMLTARRPQCFLVSSQIEE